MPTIGSWLSRLLGKRSAADPSGGTDFRLLAETSSDVIVRIGPDMIPVYVSPSVERVFGWTVAEMIASGAGGFIHPEDAMSVGEVHARLTSGRETSAKASFRVFCKDGTPLWVEANATPVRESPAGAQGDVVIVMRDISERKRLEEELRALSLTDGLTGLANRRAFDEALAREWQRTARDGSQLSLLLLDIDHFKRFNDLYGHQAGDDCLRVVALAIRGVVGRPADLVARYGGEEMAIILPDTIAEGAAIVAENVRAAIEALAIHHSGNVDVVGTVTASIGVATAFARVGGTMKMPEGLLLAADAALYKAKREGRNRISTTILLAARDGATVGA